MIKMDRITDYIRELHIRDSAAVSALEKVGTDNVFRMRIHICDQESS